MVFADFSLSFLRVMAGVFGLLWGSFLNVVVYRVPRGMNVATPPSHCPACKTPIRPWNNMPVFSYVIQGGKARCCGAKMSPRYVFVELIGGALSLAIVEILIRQLDPSTPLLRATMVYLAWFMVALLLVALAFIDIEHMFIPRNMSIAGVMIGLGTFSLRGERLVPLVISVVVAYLVVWLLFGKLYERLRGKPAMGLGDAYLFAIIGAWCGWQGVVFCLFAAAVQQVAFVLAVRISGRELALPVGVVEYLAELKADADAGDEEAKQLLADDPLTKDTGTGTLGRYVPFGPFLVLGYFEYVFGLRHWFQPYAELVVAVLTGQSGYEQ